MVVATSRIARFSRVTETKRKQLQNKEGRQTPIQKVFSRAKRQNTERGAEDMMSGRLFQTFGATTGNALLLPNVCSLVIVSTYEQVLASASEY